MSATTGRHSRAVPVAWLLAGIIALCAINSGHAAEENDLSHFTLDNGLEVVVLENHRAPVVSQLLIYKVGAMDEPPGKSGLAHVLEHMMFKGTEEVGPGEFSASVARNGGKDNAFTSQDITGYYQSVAADRLELVMALEADRMRNLVLDEAHFRPELQVVLEERNQRVERSPGAILHEQALPALYFNHPYGTPLIGWRHEIEGLQLPDLRRFYDRYYGPDNAILLIAGDVTAVEVRRLAETYYGPIPPLGVRQSRGATLREPIQRASRRVSLADPRVRQARWSRLMLAPGWGEDGMSRESLAMQVLMDILGGSNAGRLYRELVIGRGIALSAYGWYDPARRGPGALGLGVLAADGVELDVIEAAVDEIIAEIAADGVTQDAIDRAVQRLRDAHELQRDSLRDPLWSIGSDLATGLDLETILSWPQRLGEVGVDDVQAAARTWLAAPGALTMRLTRAPAADDNDAVGNDTATP